MSNYPPPAAYPPPGYPPQQQPSGCGCGGCLGKFFILLGVLFFLAIVVCCGGGYFVGQSFKNSVTQQPGEVQAISDEIAPMHVPAPLQPLGGGRFRMPISNTQLGQGAIYQSPNKKAILILGSFTKALGPQFEEQLTKSLEAGPNQQPDKNDDLREDLKDEKVSTIERTIRGQLVTFRISEGIGVHTGKKKIQAQGAFEGKLGPAILLVIAEEDTLSREQVDGVIQSIDDGAQEKK